MGATKIEWTSFPRNDGTLMPGYTANLWWGCAKVHSGCDHCYAEALSKRFGDDVWGNDKPRRKIRGFWKDLDKYQKLAKEANEVRRVFVGSMMDIFERPMPMIDSKGQVVSHPIMEGLDPINELGYSTGSLRTFFFAEITNGSYPNLMFLLLTKRPSNINKYIPESWKENPPENVMFGTSPVNQETANKLIPQLLKVKGKKFLSIEPQIDKIELHENWLIGSPFQKGQIDWVIQGGESGRHKRPFNTNWAIEIRDFCAKFKTPYFFKQIDKVQSIPQNLLIRQFPT